MKTLRGIAAAPIFSNLSPTLRGYRSLAIRGRRIVTRHDLGKFSAFFDVSARPAWERSLEGVLEERLRGNVPKNLRKSRKIIPRPSKIEPRGLQNRAWSPPRRHFYKTSILRRLKRADTKTFGSQNGQLGSILEAQGPPKSRPKPQKIDGRKIHSSGIDF